MTEQMTCFLLFLYSLDFMVPTFCFFRLQDRLRCEQNCLFNFILAARSLFLQKKYVFPLLFRENTTYDHTVVQTN